MLYVPTIGAQLSGALGGIVASHNAGGAYFRVRSTPTNPGSPQQSTVRDAVALLSVMWNDALTSQARARWNQYADNVRVTNRIGLQVLISGLAHFIRSNVGRIQAPGVAVVQLGPQVYNLSSHSSPSISNASEATQQVDFNFFTQLLTDSWANEVGGFMTVFLSREQNTTINYFKGPYRLVGPVTGDPVPPASPAVINAPFPIAAGNKIFGRAVSMTADGRYSTSSFFETVVGA